MLSDSGTAGRLATRHMAAARRTRLLVTPLGMSTQRWSWSGMSPLSIAQVGLTACLCCKPECPPSVSSSDSWVSRSAAVHARFRVHCQSQATVDSPHQCHTSVPRTGPHTVPLVYVLGACAGHDILMATMLNGAAVMDGALLLIAANETCPQPQTSEHLAAVEIMRLEHIIILQNKIDLIR